MVSCLFSFCDYFCETLHCQYRRKYYGLFKQFANRMPSTRNAEGKQKSKNGLSSAEEFCRVEAIKYFISKGYSKENFWIEPIIKHFGNAGRNSFRSDFAVLDVPASAIPHNDTNTLTLGLALTP